MDCKSLKQHFVLITLAAFGSASTFTLMVLAPLAITGGLA